MAPGHIHPNMLPLGLSSVPLKQSPSCPSLSACPTEEQSASCRRLTELRNLTKGPCYLDQVEVSYCSGHCPSSTNVMPEVSKGAAVQAQGSPFSPHPRHRMQESPADTGTWLISWGDSRSDP